METLKRNAGILFLSMVLLFSSNVFAQLPAFSFTVSATQQTCLGNGSLAFTVSGTQPGAVMGYQVYLLPNTTAPVATVSVPAATNLIAGNYMVVATQTIGNLTNTATATATIGNQVVPLVYNLIATPARCGGDGEITVNVTSGVAAWYEIISGPVIVPQQASNVFTSLPAGDYSVRVHNNCGDAVVVGAQILQEHTGVLIGNLSEQLAFPAMVTCTTVLVANDYIVSGNNVVFWPITCQYTVYPPGGGTPIVITTNGTPPVPDEGDYTAVVEIPFYYGQNYYYDLKVTDACGNVFTENLNVVNGEQNWEIMSGFSPCVTDTFTFNMLGFVGLPATVTFLSAPAGFNPSEYNSSYPVISASQTIYHKVGATFPLGDYTVQITDACGRSSIRHVSAGLNQGVEVISVGASCASGTIRVLMSGKEAILIEFTSAPPGYPLPQDLSGFIADFGDYAITGLPPGDYVVHIIDECGYEHFKNVTVDVANTLPPAAFQLPGCAGGEGSVRINGGSVLVTAVTITTAPPLFVEVLPYEASGNIHETGLFNMDSLPAGQYTFNVTTECGPTVMEVNIKGYTVTKNDIDIIPNCGYFNISLYHSSNAGNLQNFWLQKYDEVNNVWEHPLTGNDYVEGTAITNAYAISLTNNSVITGLAFIGKFRIVKVFFSYDDGQVQLSRCTDTLKEFVYDGTPEIINAYGFPCANGTADVAIEAIGVPPLNYTITQKNGQPFNVDNGASALFTGLEPAVYNFQVSDTCGNLRNIAYDITELNPLIIQEEGFCIGQDSELYLPDFSFLMYNWWKEGEPGVVLSTTSRLLFPAFDPVTDSGTYYVSITTTSPGSCIDILRVHTVDADGFPDAGDDAALALCNDAAQVDLNQYLSQGHDEGGVWTDTDATGALSGSMVSLNVMAQGTYNYTYTVTNACGLTDEAIVQFQLESIPPPVTIMPVGPSCEGDTIQLSASVDGATYEWTGPNGFASNEQNAVINNALQVAEGAYFLRVISPGSNCFSQASVVWVEVNAMPQFTVNGSAAACQGQTSSLSVTPLNFNGDTVIYTWYYEGETIANAVTGSITATEPGTYAVEVNYNNCVSNREIEVEIGENPFELVLESGCINYDYMLWVANLADIAGATVTWTGPDNFSFTGPEANITNLSKGEYTATVTNGEGCTAVASITVDNTTCIIPRGISPNGDGMNDSFDLSNLDVIELKIFNRYGLKVYEAQNYLTEWHGQSDKGTLPTATYYYVVTLSAGKQVTGWVYLQREE